MSIRSIDPSTGAPPPSAAQRPAAPPARDFRATLAGEEQAAKARPKAPRTEKVEPVGGHRYAEIVAGPRNGMFLNTSGNARDGLAFTLVERGSASFHIYGTGKDRQVFRVPDRDDAPKPAA